MKKLFLYIITPCFLLACKKEDNSINYDESYLKAYIHQLSDTTSYKSIFKIKYEDENYLLLNNVSTIKQDQYSVKTQYNSIIVDLEGNILSNCRTENSDICDSYTVEDTLLCFSCEDIINKYNLNTMAKINCLDYFTIEIPKFLNRTNADSAYQVQLLNIYEGIQITSYNLVFCEGSLCPDYETANSLENIYGKANLLFHINGKDTIAVMSKSKDDDYANIWVKSNINANNYLQSIQIYYNSEMKPIVIRLFESIELLNNTFY